MKRSFDLLSAAAGLIVFAPVLLALALAVWIASGRPVLFRQTRAGRNGREFTLLKFRSMGVRYQASGARRQRAGESSRTGSEGTFDAGDTSRVTPIGHILRQTKLDELPQLWNVLRGDMSLVGPRPEVRKWVEAYPERWAFVHTVRPGITDPASIRFRHEEEILAASPDPERTYREIILPQKLALYEEYVRTRSFVGDLVILFRTFFAIVQPSGQAQSGGKTENKP